MKSNENQIKKNEREIKLLARFKVIMYAVIVLFATSISLAFGL